MSGRYKQVFVERQTYRRRRLQDAARFLPVLGVVLFLVPLLWQTGARDGISMSIALTYVFLSWAALVCASFVVSLYLRGEQNPGLEAEPEADMHGDHEAE